MKMSNIMLCNIVPPYVGVPYKPCLFLEYSEDEFGYRMWDLLDKKVIRSRDIIFMEDKTIEDWRQQKPKTSSQPTTIMESALVDPFSTQPVGQTTAG